MENEVIQLDVELNTGKAKTEFNQLTEVVVSLRNSVDGISATFAKAFTQVTTNAKATTAGILAANDAIAIAMQTLGQFAIIQELQPGEQWAEGISIAGNICTIIQTMIALTNELVLAKLASKAEDVAIIALYAADYVEAFGKLIVQLTTSAAKWVAETAAKAASTVAQWAQNAAVAAWQVICVAATAVTTAFGAAMTFLTSPIGLVVIGITALIAIIVLLVKNWDTVSAKAKEVLEFVKEKFQEFNAFLTGVFAKDWTENFGAFGNVFNGFLTSVGDIWNAIKTIFGGIIDFVKNIFAGNWSAAWDSIVTIFGGVWDLLIAKIKTPINCIIGMINGLVAGVVSGINLVIKAINSIQVTVPDWIPVIGGQSFGFYLRTMTAPQIPYLAQGAVLPANRPFLAVVGDQRHGTNVEAPLTTIQEAVTVALDSRMAAMMDVFQALLNEQRETRRSVESITIGDDMLAKAVDRYNRKMAVVYGSPY